MFSYIEMREFVRKMWLPLLQSERYSVFCFVYITREYPTDLDDSLTNLEANLEESRAELIIVKITVDSTW